MILIFLSYRSGKTEQTGIRSRGILEFLAEFRMMRNSASYGGLHHAELRIMRNSASCRTPHAIFRMGLEAFAEKESQYSASCGTPHHAELHMLFSARNWKPLRKKSPNTPQRCGTPHWISASCGVFKQIFRSMRNSAV